MALVATPQQPLPTLKRVAFHQHCHLIPDEAASQGRLKLPRRSTKTSSARPSSSAGRPSSSSGGPSHSRQDLGGISNGSASGGRSMDGGPSPRLGTAVSAVTTDSYFPQVAPAETARPSTDKSSRPRPGSRSRSISGKMKGKLSKFGIGSSSEPAPAADSDQEEELLEESGERASGGGGGGGGGGKISPAESDVKRERSASRNRFGLGGSRTDLLLASTSGQQPLRSALKKPRIDQDLDQGPTATLESFEASAMPADVVTQPSSSARVGEGPPIAYFADEPTPSPSSTTPPFEVVCAGDSVGVETYDGEVVPLLINCSCKDCDERIKLGLVEDYEPTWSRSARIKYLSDRQRAQVLARQRLDAADRLAGRSISMSATPPPGLLPEQSSFGQLSVDGADGKVREEVSGTDTDGEVDEDRLNAIALSAMLANDANLSHVGGQASEASSDDKPLMSPLKLGPQPRRSSLDLSHERSPVKSPASADAQKAAAVSQGDEAEDEEDGDDDDDLGAEAKARLLDAIRDDPTGEALAMALSASSSRAASRKSSVHSLKGLAERSQLLASAHGDQTLQATLANEVGLTAPETVQPVLMKRPVAVVRPLSFGGEPDDCPPLDRSVPEPSPTTPFSDDDLADELSALRVRAENQARWTGTKSSGARAMMRQLEMADAKETQARKRLSIDSSRTTSPPPERYGTPVWTPPSRTNSPLPRGTSPLARTASPLHRAASPLARTASPLQRTSSPGHVNGWLANDTTGQGATLLSDVTLAAGNMAFNTCLNAYSPEVDYESATSSLHSSPATRFKPLRQDSNPSPAAGARLNANMVSAMLDGHGSANDVVPQASDDLREVPKVQVQTASASSTLTFRPTPIRPTAQTAIQPEEGEATPTNAARHNGVPKTAQNVVSPSAQQGAMAAVSTTTTKSERDALSDSKNAAQPAKAEIVEAPPRSSSAKRSKRSSKTVVPLTNGNANVNGTATPTSRPGTANGPHPALLSKAKEVEEADSLEALAADSLGLLDANSLIVLPEQNMYGMSVSHSSLRLSPSQPNSNLSPTSEAKSDGRSSSVSEEGRVKTPTTPPVEREWTTEERQRAAERAARRERARRISNTEARPSLQQTSSRPSSRGLDKSLSSGATLGVDELPPQPSERTNSNAANGKFWNAAILQTAPAPGMVGASGVVHRGTHSNQRSSQATSAKVDKVADRRKAGSNGVIGGIKGMLGRKKEK